MSDGDVCEVCDEPIPDEYGKWDPKAPVYADDYVYHKGCENELFEWSIEAEDSRNVDTDTCRSEGSQ